MPTFASAANATSSMATRGIASAAIAGSVLAAGQGFAAVDPVTGFSEQNSALFSFKYEMDLDPGDFNEIDLDSNGFDDFLGTSGVKNPGGTITINSDRPTPNQSYLSLTANEIWSSAALGLGVGDSYTVEVRMAVTSGEVHFGASGPSANDGWLMVQTGGAEWEFTRSIDLGASDNTQMTTWRMAYDAPDGVFYVWRDGVLVTSPAGLPDGFTTGTVNRLAIGSVGTGFGEGITEIDYLRFSKGAFAPGVIPEPASVALLGLGGLCAASRRRR